MNRGMAVDNNWLFLIARTVYRCFDEVVLNRGPVLTMTQFQESSLANL
jgi:hypothetical protein